jgi:hypothetical protein
MENTYVSILYKNKRINILKFLSESNTTFQKRLSFIKKLEKYNIHIDEIENLSIIWYYIKYKNCKYDNYTMNKIAIYDK